MEAPTPGAVPEISSPQKDLLKMMRIVNPEVSPRQSPKKGQKAKEADPKRERSPLTLPKRGADPRK